MPHETCPIGDASQNRKITRSACYSLNERHALNFQCSELSYRDVYSIGFCAKKEKQEKTEPNIKIEICAQTLK